MVRSEYGQIIMSQSNHYNIFPYQLPQLRSSSADHDKLILSVIDIIPGLSLHSHIITDWLQVLRNGRKLPIFASWRDTDKMNSSSIWTDRVVLNMLIL